MPADCNSLTCSFTVRQRQSHAGGQDIEGPPSTASASGCRTPPPARRDSPEGCPCSAPACTGPTRRPATHLLVMTSLLHGSAAFDAHADIALFLQSCTVQRLCAVPTCMRGGVWAKHWTLLFMKQVLPRLRSPALPRGRPATCNSPPGSGIYWVYNLEFWGPLTASGGCLRAESWRTTAQMCSGQSQVHLRPTSTLGLIPELCMS